MNHYHAIFIVNSLYIIILIVQQNNTTFKKNFSCDFRPELLSRYQGKVWLVREAQTSLEDSIYLITIFPAKRKKIIMQCTTLYQGHISSRW